MTEPRHRKNAAEWVMWTALQPVVWVCRLWEWINHDRRDRRNDDGPG